MQVLPQQVYKLDQHLRINQSLVEIEEATVDEEKGLACQLLPCKAKA